MVYVVNASRGWPSLSACPPPSWPYRTKQAYWDGSIPQVNFRLASRQHEIPASGGCPRRSTA